MFVRHVQHVCLESRKQVMQEIMKPEKAKSLENDAESYMQASFNNVSSRGGGGV